jgi:hypothetical protein
VKLVSSYAASLPFERDPPPVLPLIPGGRVSQIKRVSMWVPGEAFEEFFPWFGAKDRKTLGDLLLKPIKERILMMAGDFCFDMTKAIADLPFGATAYGLTNTTLYFGLWAAAIGDTLEGNAASECAYGSYARLALTNNTTIFAAGTGTTNYTKTFPSDAVKSFVTSTATGTNNTVTYLGILNGNAGTTSDKGYAWCTITSTTINSGDTPQLAQNAVTVTLT